MRVARVKLEVGAGATHSGEAEMTASEQRNTTDIIPEEFGGLLAEFRGLLEKYPDADQHFSLAYHPTGKGDDAGTTTLTTTAGSHQPVFECPEIEPGFVVCERVDKQ